MTAIITAAELDSLPVGSVVVDPHGMGWQKRVGFTRPSGIRHISWFACGVDDGGHDVVARPATLLYRPDVPAAGLRVTREAVESTARDVLGFFDPRHLAFLAALGVTAVDEVQP